jgi:hypothetical protein
VEQGRELLVAPAAGALARWDVRVEATRHRTVFSRLGWHWTGSELGIGGPTLCSASKPYNEDDADGQQGAGKPESDECLAPVRAVARRLEDPDADAPCVERPNERGEAPKAERAESRRPGEGSPKACGDRPLPSTWVR